MELVFKVSKVGMDCAVPFPRLFQDLSKGKDVVTARAWLISVCILCIVLYYVLECVACIVV